MATPGVSITFSLLAGLFMSAAASMEPYAARRVGPWIVAPSGDAPGCFLTRQYAGEGGTTLLFGLDTDNSNHLSVLNDNWSIKPKARLALSFRLSGRRYPKQVAIGMASNGKRGFVAGFESTFPASFAASPFLYIDRGDVPVARLGLDGSGPAIAELRRCVSALKVKAKVRPSVKATAGVPKDPFSSDFSERTRKHQRSTRGQDGRDND